MNEKVTVATLVERLRNRQEKCCMFIPCEQHEDDIEAVNEINRLTIEVENLRAENATLEAFAAKLNDEKMLLLRELKDA